MSGGGSSYLGQKLPIDIGDPLHIFPDNGLGNQARKGTAGDPLGLLYKPPTAPGLASMPDVQASESVTTAPGDPNNAVAAAGRDLAAEDERKKQTSARGRASTIFTSSIGDTSAGVSARKILLGE